MEVEKKTLKICMSDKCPCPYYMILGEANMARSSPKITTFSIFFHQMQLLFFFCANLRTFKQELASGRVACGQIGEWSS